MSTTLLFARDAQGYNAYAPQFATDLWSGTLAASTAKSITIPSNFPTWVMYVTVQPTGWCWCSSSGTATIPADSDLDPINSEMIVGTIEYKKTVYAGDVISFITANTTCDVGIKIFPINS